MRFQAASHAYRAQGELIVPTSSLGIKGSTSNLFSSLELELQTFIFSCILALKMGKAIETFTAKLHKAAASRGADGVPQVTVISADTNGVVLPIVLDSGANCHKETL
jgi:hypothetical protein